MHTEHQIMDCHLGNEKWDLDKLWEDVEDGIF